MTGVGTIATERIPCVRRPQQSRTWPWPRQGDRDEFSFGQTHLPACQPVEILLFCKSYGQKNDARPHPHPHACTHAHALVECLNAVGTPSEHLGLPACPGGSRPRLVPWHSRAPRRRGCCERLRSSPATQQGPRLQSLILKPEQSLGKATFRPCRSAGLRAHVTREIPGRSWLLALARVGSQGELLLCKACQGLFAGTMTLVGFRLLLAEAELFPVELSVHFQEWTAAAFCREDVKYPC